MSPERPAPGGRRARRWRLVLARREAVPASLRRFMGHAARRLRRAGDRPAVRRNRRRIAIGVGAAGAAVVVLIAALVVVYQTGVLGVREVRVTGTRLLSAAEVRTAAAVPADTPLAGVDLDAVRRRVAALRPVRTVTVERDFPHALVVRVAERTAVAVVPEGRQSRLIDATGLVFHTAATRPPTVPVIVLARPSPGDAATRSALAVLRALTPTLRADLVRLEAPRPTRIRLVLRHGPTIVWGDASASARKAAAATALLGKGGSTIDVSAPDLAVVR